MYGRGEGGDDRMGGGYNNNQMDNRSGGGYGGGQRNNAPREDFTSDTLDDGIPF